MAKKSQRACESQLTIFCHQIFLPYPFRDYSDSYQFMAAYPIPNSVGAADRI